MRLIGLVLTSSLRLAPLTAAAQQAGRVYRIGYLSPRSGIESQDEALRRALGQLGYVEGQNLVIEWRFTKGQAVAPELAAGLVQLKLDCILVRGVGGVAALKRATATIPIVIGTIDADPVEEGLVASFARPGGNITGITGIAYELAGKRLELAPTIAPVNSQTDTPESGTIWRPSAVTQPRPYTYHPGPPGLHSLAERIFPTLRVERLLLEYDDERSGGSEPLSHTPEETTCVLGLVTTKSGRRETVGELSARIREAARVVPLERLALSPQCGFATSVVGNALTVEDELAKLRTIVETARAVWG